MKIKQFDIFMKLMKFFAVIKKNISKEHPALRKSILKLKQTRSMKTVIISLNALMGYYSGSMVIDRFSVKLL